MKTVEQHVEDLKGVMDDAGVDVLERMSRYTLADAIREGSQASGQARNFTDADDNLCALSAAVVAREARGY